MGSGEGQQSARNACQATTMTARAMEPQRQSKPHRANLRELTVRAVAVDGRAQALMDIAAPGRCISVLSAAAVGIVGRAVAAPFAICACLGVSSRVACTRHIAGRAASAGAHIAPAVAVRTGRLNTYTISQRRKIAAVVSVWSRQTLAAPGLVSMICFTC